MNPRVANSALLVMAKQPAPGRVKTRLCPPLRPGQAAGLYRAMLGDVLEEMSGVGRRRFLAVHPPGAELPGLPTAAFERLDQRGDGLAERMVEAFAAVFEHGCAPVVMRNSDSPGLPAARVEQALDRLADPGVDVVLGPDGGGGYYLVGLNRPQPRLFTEVAMSTGSMLDATLAVADTLGLGVKLLEPALDVDRPEDLAALAEACAAQPRRHARTGPALARIRATLG